MSTAAPEPPEPPELVAACTVILQGVVREAHYMVKRDGVWTCLVCGATR